MNATLRCKSAWDTSRNCRFLMSDIIWAKSIAFDMPGARSWTRTGACKLMMEHCPSKHLHTSPALSACLLKVESPCTGLYRLQGQRVCCLLPGNALAQHDYGLHKDVALKDISNVSHQSRCTHAAFLSTGILSL